MGETPKYLMAVDPGLRGCGWARFEGRSFYACGYARNPASGRGPSAWAGLAEWMGNRGSSCDLAIEYPQVYTFGKSKGDPNDLIDVAGVAGAVVGAVAWEKVTGYLPREWKGQVPKEIHHARIKAALTPAELKVAWNAAVPASLMHNVWDAIGIGLYHLKATGVRP